MRIRQTRVFLGLVTTLFCTIAFSSTGTDQAGDPTGFEVAGGSESVMQKQLLLAKNEPKVEVCKTNKSNGNMETLKMTQANYEKKTADTDNSHLYMLGPCEDVVSKS